MRKALSPEGLHSLLLVEGGKKTISCYPMNEMITLYVDGEYTALAYGGTLEEYPITDWVNDRVREGKGYVVTLPYGWVYEDKEA